MPTFAEQSRRLRRQLRRTAATALADLSCAINPEPLVSDVEYLGNPPTDPPTALPERIQPEFRRSLPNPDAPHRRMVTPVSNTITLQDYADDEGVIRGYDFRDVAVQGPVVLWFDLSSGAFMRSCQVRTLDIERSFIRGDGPIPTGVISLVETSFLGCLFEDVGFYGDQASLAAIRDSFSWRHDNA